MTLQGWTRQDMSDGADFVRFFPNSRKIIDNRINAVQISIFAILSIAGPDKLSHL
jgi:hypothetical protein